MLPMASYTCPSLLQMASATGVHCDVDTLWVLDASNSSKFSRHIIISMAGTHAWLGNVHEVGTAAKNIIAQAVSHHPAMFLVQHAQQSLHKCVIDDGVYSRNQQFRVMYSSKLGEDRPLLPYNRCCPGIAACSWQEYAPSLVVAGRREFAVAGCSTASPSVSVGSCCCLLVLACIHCWKATLLQS